MKCKIVMALILLTAFSAGAQLPKVVSGTIQRIDSFASQYVTPRNVDIWLPKGYSSQKKYPVLYMHDGQMLYDASTTWNKTAWEVDDVLTQLFAEKKLRQIIVVGIWNGGATRHIDYFPQRPFDDLTAVEKDTISAQLMQKGRVNGAFQPQSDNYLKFLVNELKPYIDGHYSTLADRQHTFIAGSSMGGLISMYAVCEYPNIFGGAACLSTHWPGTFTTVNNPIPQAFVRYLEQHLPDPATHRLYFDCGDQTLDALYPPIQKRVDEVMRKKGYTADDWMTRFFPGEDHSEKAWHKRFAIPLLFLLQ